MQIRSGLLGLLLLGAADLSGGAVPPASALAPVVVGGEVMLRLSPSLTSVPESDDRRLGCGYCEYNILITYDWFSCSGDPHAGSCEPHNLIPEEEHCHWSSANSCQIASLDRGLGGAVLAATPSCSNDTGESVYFDRTIASARGSVRLLAEDWIVTWFSDED